MSTFKKVVTNKYTFWQMNGVIYSYSEASKKYDTESLIDNTFKIMERCYAQKCIAIGDTQDDKDFITCLKSRKILTDVVLCDNTSTAIAIMEYCKLHKISIKNVVYIDTDINELHAAQRFGITALHFSKLIDLI